MKPAVNTRTYDLIKGIVVLLLLVTLVWLLLSGAAKPASPSAEISVTSDLPGKAAQEQGTGISQPVVASPTATKEPVETALPTSVNLATVESTAVPASPTPALTPEKMAEATEIVTTTSAPVIEVDCPLALPTRLKVGDRSVVVTNLNMRTEAGITKKLIRTNPAGTELTIIGGPVCEAYEAGAYLWWQVQRVDEENGWSAEGSLTDQFYFLQPVE